MDQVLLLFCILGVFVSTPVSGEDNAPRFCHGIDCPKYTVVERTDDYEFRSYDASKWVSTVVDGFHFVQSQRTGFNRLFAYISGANVPRKRVEMTAPVRSLVTPTEGPFCETKFTVSFFVPFDVQDEIPAPTSKSLFIEETPEMRVYVTSFGGFMTEDGVIQRAAALIEALQKKGIAVDTEKYYACGYDSPFRLIGRHNEIWIIGKDESTISAT